MRAPRAGRLHSARRLCSPAQMADMTVLQGSGTLPAPGASAVAVILHLGELLPQYQLTQQDVATLTLAALADIWKVSLLTKTAS